MAYAYYNKSIHFLLAYVNKPGYTIYRLALLEKTIGYSKHFRNKKPSVALPKRLAKISIVGAPPGIRTQDLPIKSRMLYQLS